MRLPRSSLGNVGVARDVLTGHGLNLTDNFQDGDLADCSNVSLRRWPYLTTDIYNGVWRDESTRAVQGMAFYDGELVELRYPGEVYKDGVKQTLSFLPYDSAARQECGTIFFNDEGDTEISENPFVIVGPYLFPQSGGIVHLDTLELRRRGDVLEAAHFYVLESEKAVFYTYDPRNPDKLEDEEFLDALNLRSMFAPGDVVTLSASGLPEQALVVKNAGVGVIRFEAEPDFSSGTSWAEKWGQTGAIFSAGSADHSSPELDLFCVHDNRVWGASTEDSTVWASSLGDPFNFKRYQGLSTDSYSLSFPTVKAFTGCCSHSSGVVFFTENGIYKIVGTYPAEYTLVSQSAPGVKKGCWRSVASANDSILYVGPAGVYRYAGGQPEKLSSRLGRISLSNAVAGFNGRCYIVWGETLDEWAINPRQVLTLALDTGLWVRTPVDFRAYHIFRYEGVPYGDSCLISAEESGAWRVLQWDGGERDRPLLSEWHVEFTPFYDQSQGKKRPRRLVLRLELDSKAWVRAMVSQDEGRWKEAGVVKGEKTGVVEMRLAPGRCDVYRLRLEGNGRCVIRAITRESVTGGVR